MNYPTGYLLNAKTGRCHPISFRLAPLPGGKDAEMSAQRYKSIGHHTAGFESVEDARAWVAAQKTDTDALHDVGTVWEWDGEDVPAMVQWFSEGVGQ